MPFEPYKWLFLDLNSFFASVEQQENPRLLGRPVAIVPLGSDSTCAIAASQEAKRYGIRTGTRIYDAKKLCPDLVCVPAQHDLYVTYHHKIMAEIIRHVPINKIWSIDECSSRLPPAQRSEEKARAVALRIKEGLRRNIGSTITCSIGIAPNGYLAKVATNMQKPDGLVVLDESCLPQRLFDLDLKDLTGINTAMKLRLARAGVFSVRQFYNLAPKQARAVWGSVEGERFWYRLRGADLPDVETHSSMVGHSRILDPELRAPDKARLVARRLTIKAAGRLRRMDMYAADFALAVREAGEDGERFASALRATPAQDNFTFLAALDQLWQEMMLEIKPWRIKKVSVSLYNLHEIGRVTRDLFDEAVPEIREHQQKNEKLSSAMDAINRKYGAESIRLGVSPKTQAGYVGTKIAFSRIPDIAEFHE